MHVDGVGMGIESCPRAALQYKTIMRGVTVAVGGSLASPRPTYE